MSRRGGLASFFTRIAVVVASIALAISVAEGVLAVPQSPPLKSNGEEIISASHPEIVTCSEAFSEVVGSKIVLVHQSFSRSSAWGFTMRAVFHNIGDSGQQLPLSSFICWRQPGKPIGVAIAPVEDGEASYR
jgi:hypothetical protein